MLAELEDINEALMVAFGALCSMAAAGAVAMAAFFEVGEILAFVYGFLAIFVALDVGFSQASMDGDF